MEKGRRRPRSRRWRTLVLLSAIIALLAVNGIAYMQARAMTRYAAGGQRTASPEQLSPAARVWAVVAGVTVPRPENRRTPADAGLVHATHRIAGPDGTVLEAWFVPHPASRAVVIMFHGYATSKDSLLRPAAALHDLGYDLLLVDFRGSGGSSGADTSLGLREGADVAQAVGYARQTWPGRPIVLYGVSMGTAAILRAVATEGVEPAAIVLESPFDRLLTTVGNRFRAMALPALPGAELVVLWGSLQQGNNGFAHNPAEYAAAVTCPTLLLIGEHDARVTPEQAMTIFENLGGRKQFVRFPHAGHELLMTASPDLWKQRVADFLRQVERER